MLDMPSVRLTTAFGLKSEIAYGPFKIVKHPESALLQAARFFASDQCISLTKHHTEMMAVYLAAQGQVVTLAELSDAMPKSRLANGTESLVRVHVHNIKARIAKDLKTEMSAEEIEAVTDCIHPVYRQGMKKSERGDKTLLGAYQILELHPKI